MHITLHARLLDRDHHIFLLKLLFDHIIFGDILFFLVFSTNLLMHLDYVLGMTLSNYHSKELTFGAASLVLQYS